MPNKSRASKKRLNHLLTGLGLAESDEKAKRLIMAGLVYVNGQRCDKPGTQIAEDADIEVRETLRYVSRGGLKLEAALDHFNLDPRNATCLDVGASTGGFSDCLLQRGASRVFAVDVGRGQLHYRLQNDERVINLERTHIRDLTDTDVPAPVDALVIDTSFISLSRVLPPAWKFLKPDGWCVALIKPQFEVDVKNIGKGGVVRGPEIRRRCVDRVVEEARSLEQAKVLGVIESPITGPKGNIEYLLALSRAAGT